MRKTVIKVLALSTFVGLVTVGGVTLRRRVG
jgi:hypothetical protein